MRIEYLEYSRCRYFSAAIKACSYVIFHFIDYCEEHQCNKGEIHIKNELKYFANKIYNLLDNAILIDIIK